MVGNNMAAGRFEPLSWLELAGIGTSLVFVIAITAVAFVVVLAHR
jgi:hypothetical protein